jgi:lipid-A-disaccharide synthase
MTADRQIPAIMLIAGEASGDLHGATLCRALRERVPDARLFGMGGARMAAAGMDVLEDVTAGAIVGGTEAAAGVLPLYRAYRRLRARLAGPDRPHALVLIDFPEFNLRLARTARRHGVPVVYFIPPQIWAWRGWRVSAMRRLLSLVLAVFPFEPPLYRRAGVPVEYVGHPLVDALAGAPTRAAARARLGLTADACVVGLLPGSRRGEIARLLPVMREAIARITARRPDTRVVLALAPTIDAEVVARCLELGGSGRFSLEMGGSGRPPRPPSASPATVGSPSPPVLVVRDAAYDVMRAADLVLATSGTVTLEAALLGAPMVVCYRVSRLSAMMIRSLVRVPWMCLVNIVMGRAVVPELFQEEATGERVAAEALHLLEDADAREAQRAAFRELAGGLGDPGVGARAAGLILGAARRAS